MYADDYYNDDNGYVNNDDYLNKRFEILIISIIKYILTINYYFKIFRLYIFFLFYIFSIFPISSHSSSFSTRTPT